MKRLFLAISALAFAATAASADAISDRQELMKERGRITGGLAKMAKGETAFDAAATLTALQAMAANAEKATNIEALWPAGSETGGDTESSPKIWEDATGFKAAADKFKSDVDAAVAAPPADVAALQATLGTIGKDCGGCHEVYRIKK